MLSQIHQDGTTHPVAYYSRKLSPAELNYGIYDKEMLAIVAAIREWRPYLEGSQHHFTILTDHKNLEYFTTSKVLNRRQARWAELISGYDFVIVYRPGRKNGKADAMSRRHDYRPEEGKLQPDKDRPLLKPDQMLVSATFQSEIDTNFRNKLLSALEEDPVTYKMIQHLKSPSFHKPPEDSSVLENCSIENDLLLKNNRIYVPNSDALKLDIVRRYHDSSLAGHVGQFKTHELIARNYWWPAMRAFVNNYVASCDECQRCKTPRHKPFGTLQPLPIPKRPWASISMDFIVKLPVSSGYDSILVVVDRFTKMAHFIPCNENATSVQLAVLFLDNVFKHHGLPEEMVSDRGSLFISNFWKGLMKLLNVNINLSTSYHPQSNGQTERVNAILEQYLRVYCNYQQCNWSSLLPMAQFSYNNALHVSTGKSPFFANYGFHPVFNPLPHPTSKVPAAEELLKTIESTHRFLSESIKTAQASYSNYYNRKSMDAPNFKVGSLVWLMRKNIKTQRPSDKLDHRRLGPFKILQKVGPLSYRLELPVTMKIHDVFHVSLLEPYFESSSRKQNPPPCEINGELEYEVARILDSRVHNRQVEYLDQV